MGLAIAGTLFHDDIKPLGYVWIAIGAAAGSIAGASMGLQIPMTAVPQRTALSHSLGALAATLIGVSDYFFPIHHVDADSIRMTTIGFEVIIGALTFTGSLIAAGKLQELLPGAPITYQGQNICNFFLLAVLLGSFIALICDPTMTFFFFII